MKAPSTSKKVITILFRFLRVLIVLGIAGVLAYMLVSFKKEPEKKEIVKTPPSVNVISAESVSKVMTVNAYGTVKPRKLVKIAVEVPGRITYLNPSFIEGGYIGKGETLIRLDQRSYRLDLQAGEVRIDQAQTDIASFVQDIENLKKDLLLSKANMALAKKELDRMKALTKNQFASENSLDKVEQQYLQSRIQLQNVENRLSLTSTTMEQKKSALSMARVDFEKADLALAKTKITAAFDGFVLDKYAEQGEYANPGQIIGSIYQKDSLDVDVRIPLEKMKWIESFFGNGKTPLAKVLVANFESLKTHVWDAKVVRVKAKVDEKTRTLPITLEILNPDVKIKGIFDLKPGTFVKCTILGETIDNLFVVPRHMLKPKSVLYIVNDNHLKMKKVDILRKFEDEIYVRSGLITGDKIISSPLPGALEGMELIIKENGN
ncbi:MAG: efflux RND transporter periplasmic adaptor subunit [Desulfobacula sp.]|nr:efflux RND transporter periplasmic adaptor subunit [Desulfobacula sp.]